MQLQRANLFSYLASRGSQRAEVTQVGMQMLQNRWYKITGPAVFSCISRLQAPTVLGCALLFLTTKQEFQPQ